ncbi:creatininase family protein [Actinokineospora spheciospongiae]|uniref:creatininase family protein n=1 Tax=Actinokineospora spheciospongiae TaxID=909613 RepID=UPI000D9D7308|nr:creatininase family protein [Actinokineospora spheciospongiae]PWW63591.1 creatinine amidohydrolase [Actinokineospora spheciospongiae]
MFAGATAEEEAERGASVAVLPVGSFEQHGGHLPLATDAIIAEIISRRVAFDYSLFCLPPITMSCSHEHEGFAGTVSISAGTLIAMIGDIRASLARSGVHKLVMVNGHGGNYVLSNIAQEANVNGPVLGLFPGSDDVDTARRAAGMATSAHEDMHGGEWETSILLHAHPEVVRPSYRDADFDAPHRPHLHAVGMSGYTKSGIIGRPSLATADKGRLALDSLSSSFGALLRVLGMDAGRA